MGAYSRFKVGVPSDENDRLVRTLDSHKSYKRLIFFLSENITANHLFTKKETNFAKGK